MPAVNPLSAAQLGAGVGFASKLDEKDPRYIGATALGAATGLGAGVGHRVNCLPHWRQSAVIQSELCLMFSHDANE